MYAWTSLDQWRAIVVCTNCCRRVKVWCQVNACVSVFGNMDFRRATTISSDSDGMIEQKHWSVMLLDLYHASDAITLSWCHIHASTKAFQKAGVNWRIIRNILRTGTARKLVSWSWFNLCARQSMGHYENTNFFVTTSCACLGIDVRVRQHAAWLHEHTSSPEVRSGWQEMCSQWS